MSSFLTSNLVGAILRAIEPIDIAYKTKESFTFYLQQHGINISITDADFTKITNALNVSASFSDSSDFYQQMDSSSGDDLDVLTGLINVIKSIVTQVNLLTEGTPDATLTPPLNSDLVWQNLGRETLDRLIFEAIEGESPALSAVFLFCGIAEINPISITDATHVPYVQYKINWEKLGDFFTDPLTQIKNNFGWEDAVNGFNYTRFYYYLQRAFDQANFFTRLEEPTSSLLNRYYSVSNPNRTAIKTLKIPFFMEIAPSFASFAEVGVQSMPIPELTNLNGKPMGFTLAPLFKGGFTSTPASSSSTGISLQVSASLETDSFFRLNILPSGISFESDTSGTSLSASISLVGKPETPYILIGSANSHRIELEGFLVSFGFKGTVSDPEFLFRAGTGEGADAPKLKFVFQAGESDGFLKTILGTEPQSIDLSGFIVWSSKTGIGFEGSAGFAILMPLHLALGPINIDAIAIEAKVGTNTDPKIGLGINLSGTIGPLSFVCEEIGAQLTIKQKQNSAEAGVFGNLDFEWGFQPPNGIGLSINAGAVIGGGYLFFDFEKEEYAGALELTIAGFISAKAIGLITTKMPDGSKGFSMLIIITAEFNPPFQLGYGFTLMGVGGLLGLNRTVLLDPLREGVRTGAVNNIMFPQNVIANAPRIISDLKTIFPAYEGKFLIGPMAKIGWGTPTLVSISFGLIIEIPGNIAILGVLSVILPDKAAAIVKIQVAFVGTIDFDKQMLTFDASLYESSILTMTLEGDMAVRLKWGDSPDFIFTVGGFHPSFTPPPLALPTLKRLAINILNTSIARIRVECYQAITSNTVQFGARADIFFDLSVCSITGFIAFDALFQFSPFYFIISISAGFKLKVAGFDLLSVRVSMSLEGPTPWRAKGTGSISILFFEVSADFDKTWGEQRNTTLESKAILTELLAALNKKEQWSTLLSTSKNLYVSLRTLDEATESLLVLHPAGSLVVQQKLLPFTINIDKIGNQKVSDVKQISVVSAQSGSSNLQLKTVNEDFARAQYQNLSDAEKLSKPSFEKMPGGVEISMSGNLIKNGKLVRKEIKYELTVIDKEPTKKRNKFFTLSGVLFTNFLKGNSVSKSPISKAYNTQLKPFEEKVELSQPGYTVAFQSNNKAFDVNATFESEMAAQTYMQTVIKQQPNLKSQVHIVPNFELQEI